jgi:cardiolipin synthase
MNQLISLIPAVRADLLLASGLVIAIAVTLHVLLCKREVGSAVGWIGLAWFAPVTGGISYFLFGVNRVQRRAQSLRGVDQRREGRGAWPTPEGGDDHLDPLERGIGRITGRATISGNRVATYQDGDEAYPPMLEAIARARRSIALSSFIFHDDVWGGHFIEALAAAQARGAAVRVLVDGIGGGWLTSPAYRALRSRGVPVVRFLHSPLPWRMPFLNLRSHKKILVLDGTLGFTGGMNIGDANVMATHPKAPVQDTHFRVEGPVVCQLMEAFARDWQFATNENLEGTDWFPDLDHAHDGAAARVIDSGPDEDIEKIEFAILQAIACARESIAIMTAYFLPDERMMTALSLAAMRGVAVDVVVPERSDHFFVDWALRANNKPLLKDGVRVWLCPPPFRHSKAMVVDGAWCLIGSCNFDTRSFRLNFELCMEFYDRALGAELSALMERSRGRALTQADLDGRPMPVRLRDAATRLMLPYL